MCGILHAKNLKDGQQVNALIKVLYENQKERGKQGFGFVGMNKDKIQLFRSTDEKGIIDYLNNYEFDEILFHHRLPTSTDNNISSTHPFELFYGDKKYYFIHNGMIENSLELFKEHKRLNLKYKLNLKYTSLQKDGKFNDSEALAWEFIIWLSDNRRSIKAVGSVAFICLEMDKELNRAEKLYFYRNDGNPLKLFKDKTTLTLSSSGVGNEIKKDRLYYYDYATKNIIKDKKLAIDYTSHEFSFNKYSQYGKTTYDEMTEFENEIEDINTEIEVLEQEKDYLVMQGDYKRANDIELDVQRLKNDQKEMEHYLYEVMY